MKLLILGGTQFIGRHIVEYIYLNHPNWDITLLHRGRTGSNLFPEIKRIYADRESKDFLSTPGLKQNWDGIIDLSAYYPKTLSSLTESLSGYVGRYVFCSTISVYKNLFNQNPTAPFTESSEVLSCSDLEQVDSSPVSYGARKAKCEQVIKDASFEHTIIRPSLVYGAYDHTDRFAYWIYKAAQKNLFLLPESGLNLVQKTYAPDLAQAFVKALQTSAAKNQTYHITDNGAYDWRDTLLILEKQFGHEVLKNAVSASAEQLERQGIQPWSDIPLWIPRSHLLLDTFKSRSELNLENTPLDQAIIKTADWFLSQNRKPNAGISFEKELEIISKMQKTN